MFLDEIEIKEGAFFISDAHDNEKRDGFYLFLKKLDAKEIVAPQLFLMGDMFDLLVGEVSYTKELFKESITLINKISEKIEIFYFEGNHDFDLQSVFPDVKVFPISLQPFCFRYRDKKILLSHGDLYQGFGYTLYTAIIRNKISLKILDFIDNSTKNFISKKILTPQIGKNICYEIENFEKIIKQKLQKYDIGITEIDFVFEGHHHQDKEFVFGELKYKNFSSFACDKSYYKITFEDEIKFIKIS